MFVKKIIFTLLLSGIWLTNIQESEARISMLSPMSYQERLETNTHEIDQSVLFQNGWSGVSPAGANTGASHILMPYLISYGVLEKFEVGASWGLHYLARKNQSNQLGINDMIVAGKYRFFDANRSKRMPGLDAEFGFSFPTGSFSKGLGTGAFGVLFGWGLVLPIDPARFQISMGYRLNTENSDNVRVGHVFSYNIGTSMPLSGVNKYLDILGEIKGFNHSKNKVNGQAVGSAEDELYFAPGASYALPHQMRVVGQFLIGLTGSSADAGFSFELQF